MNMGRGFSWEECLTSHTVSDCDGVLMADLLKLRKFEKFSP
jgi:hypothetical protein